ncbi:MAG: hypothetical protein JRH06_15245 [Deltaproteobacteria bacterium]|nr:hypothetical protein [Deltaproteobacteria bacterium]MBW2138892.1 hypothetical protein [Deltaproteobacteria bacterium]
MREKKLEKDIPSLLTDKLSMLGRYQIITRKMKNIIKRGGEVDLKPFVLERESCIRRLESIDSRLEKLFTSGCEEYPRTSDARDIQGDDYGTGKLRNMKDVVDGYLADIKSLLQAIALIEKELVVLVTEERDRIKRDIIGMRDSRNAASRYMAATIRTPMFLDKRG